MFCGHYARDCKNKFLSQHVPLLVKGLINGLILLFSVNISVSFDARTLKLYLGYLNSISEIVVQTLAENVYLIDLPE